MITMNTSRYFSVLVAGLVSLTTASAQLAVTADIIHTMAGEAIPNGVVLVVDGKITQVGPAADITIPKDYQKLNAKVIIPGLVDAHATVGLSGILNYDQDQEQLELSAPIQPELRAIDAYNARDPLVAWVRQFGVTTINTGHAPGAVVSGQAMIIKTHRENVSDAIRPLSMVMATLGSNSLSSDRGKSPGTRAKAVAILRSELVKAQGYAKKLGNADPDKHPERDLRLEVLAQVLDKKVPLLINAHRHQDIRAALRLADEFKFDLILDGAAEAYLMLDDIHAAGVPVIVHPTMMRGYGDAENMTFENARKLQDKGIPFAIQSGFEAYVPKSRVVLFEAGLAAAYGLTFDQALASITINAAKILGIDEQVGSIAVGKDADLALFDGDPFEYVTHCTGVIVDGQVVEQ